MCARTRLRVKAGDEIRKALCGSSLQRAEQGIGDPDLWRGDGDCPRARSVGRKTENEDKKQVDVWGGDIICRLSFIYAYVMISPPPSHG